MTKANVKKKQLRIIEDGIALVKFLSSNNENERNKALKKAKRVLEYRSQIGDCEYTASEARVLWKGLFYCLWMADKPLYQEQVAESISQLLHCFKKLSDALTFVKAFFSTMSQEWLGIDQFRMDKCLMLVRRMVRQSMLFVRRQHNWSRTAVDQLAGCYAAVLAAKSQKGLVMQLAELYLTELAKVSEGKLSSEQVFALVKPFAEYFVTLNDGLYISNVIVPIFFRLIEQTDIGIEHQLKWEAWRDRGFPGGSIDVMEKADEDGEEEGENNDEEEEEGQEEEEEEEDSDDEEGEKALDPRAGRVDVELPTLNIDPRMFVKLFSELKERKGVPQIARNQLNVLIKKYTTLAEGKFPMGMQKVELPPKTNWKNVTLTAAKQLSADLIDDELSKLASLKEELEDADREEVQTPVGTWSVQVAASRANIKRKKNMMKKAEKRRRRRAGRMEWVTTVTAAAANEGENGGGEEGEGEGEGCQDEDESFTLSTRKEKKKKRKLKANEEEVGEASAKSKKKKSEAVGNGIANKTNKELRINGEKEEDDWSRALEEGEVEIFIPNKKYVAKRKKLGLPVPQSEVIQSSSSNNTPCQRTSLNGKEKKVLFALKRNKFQEEHEYQKTLLTKPEIPFQPEKQPEHPIYKDTGVKSPINPFYKISGYKSY